MNTVLLNYDIELIISHDLLKELNNTIQKEKFRKYFSIEDGFLFIEKLEQRAVPVQIITPLEEWCSDAKDNYLLALSKDADANYLITGDKDLLSLKQFENTLIVTLNQFIDTINQQSA